MVEPRILTDVEVAEIEGRYAASGTAIWPDRDISPLIAWGRHWESRAQAAEGKAAKWDEYQASMKPWSDWVDAGCPGRGDDDD